MVANISGDSQVATEGLEDSQDAANKFENSQAATEGFEASQVVSTLFGDSQLEPEDLKDGVTRAPFEPPSSSIHIANLHWKTTEDEIRETFSQFGEITLVRQRAYFFFLDVFFGLCFS